MASKIRTVQKIIQPQTVLDFGDVRLKRSIGGIECEYLDPFLQLDHLCPPDPADFHSGFPAHPHRGFESITYVLAGRVLFSDSRGRDGELSAGEILWLSAGRGIMHAEQPVAVDDALSVIQLWINLPANEKASAPHSQQLRAAQIPVVTRPDGVRVRVIAGRMQTAAGPIEQGTTRAVFLDITVPAASQLTVPLDEGQTACAYLLQGEADFGGQLVAGPPTAASVLLVFSGSGSLSVETHRRAAHILLFAATPLNEPVARYGPFVMSTQDQILQALHDYKSGAFLR